MEMVSVKAGKPTFSHPIPPFVRERKLFYRDGATPSCHGNGTTLLIDRGWCGPNIDCIRVKLILIHRKWYI